jgi:hypothetical protein
MMPWKRRWYFLSEALPDLTATTLDDIVAVGIGRLVVES